MDKLSLRVAVAEREQPNGNQAAVFQAINDLGEVVAELEVGFGFRLAITERHEDPNSAILPGVEYPRGSISVSPLRATAQSSSR